MLKMDKLIIFFLFSVRPQHCVTICILASISAPFGSTHPFSAWFIFNIVFASTYDPCSLGQIYSLCFNKGEFTLLLSLPTMFNFSWLSTTWISGSVMAIGRTWLLHALRSDTPTAVINTRWWVGFPCSQLKVLVSYGDSSQFDRMWRRRELTDVSNEQHCFQDGGRLCAASDWVACYGATMGCELCMNSTDGS